MRDEAIIALRPTLAITEMEMNTAEEKFMHATLRPILKLQDPIIHSLFRAEELLNLDSLEGKQKNEAEKRAYLVHYIQKNNKLKTLLIGVIIGILSQDEFDFYLTKRKTIDKRIIEMSVTRFLSAFNQ